MADKVTSKKGGVGPVAFPDVCKTPAPPAPFVPIPYPNSQYQDNLKKAQKVDAQASAGNPEAIALQQEAINNLKKSMGHGNESGTLKGVTSASQAVQQGYVLHQGAVGQPIASQTTSVRMGMAKHKPKVKATARKPRR